MAHIAAAIAGLSLAFIGSSATIAGTINVPDDYELIQDAIDASSDGDVINIAPGIYKESNLDPGGRPITIQGTVNEDGSLATTVDALQGGSVFRFDSGEGDQTLIKDLVITGGSAPNGGGIACLYNSSPTITGCTIQGNTANSYGGGIICYDNSNPTISSCTISDNNANSGGGGICCYDKSTPAISGCTLTNNALSGGGGGGIECYDSNPTISGCTITSNTASYGGGIYCRDSSNPIISECVITANTVILTGGGISCSHSDPTISDCTIESNTANHDGGGIICYQSHPTISDCTISDNTANDGGGIYCYNSNPTINGSTIESNSSNSNGGGIACYHQSTVTMINCILENNSSINIWIDSITDSDLILASSDPPSPSAACCVSSGCVALSSDDCTAMGGNWLGEDVSCDDCPASCSGDTNNDGAIDIEDLLNMLSNFGSLCP